MSTSSTTASETVTANRLPPVRRVITGHSPHGKSVVIRDEIQPATFWSPESTSPIYDIHRTSQHPARLDSEIRKGEWVDEIVQVEQGFAGLISKNGSMMRVFDHAPGSSVVSYPLLCF
jgi:hypothetical protein